MEYIDKLQKMTKPITRLVLDSLSFYDFGTGGGRENPYIIATHLTGTGLEQMIFEYKINNKWDPLEFLKWCNAVKEIPLYPVRVEKIDDEDF